MDVFPKKTHTPKYFCHSISTPTPYVAGIRELFLASKATFAVGKPRVLQSFFQ